MKLATLPTSGRDGRLVVVSRDLSRAVAAGPETMQQALEQWDRVESELEELSTQLNRGDAEGAFDFDPAIALAPLPRAYAWLDGSSFTAHGDLMSKAFNMSNPQGATPLVYQGASDVMLGACADVPFPSDEDGIDFEGEFGVILGDVPMGAEPEVASGAIRLLVLINDWSLRRLAPAEMRAGFGWMHSKPATGFGPVVVTPDELGDAWRDHRIHLPLQVSWNGRPFGHPFGGTMNFDYVDLIRHVSKTRRLGAGTILGGGTVSEGDPERVGSACIAERRGYEIVQHGDPRTPFMHFGDRVRIEALDAEGRSVFGAIEQRVVQG